MIPNGSYTDGQQKTRQLEYNSMASGLVTIFSIHTMLPPAACAASTPARISAAISGVSGAPAHSTNCIPLGRYFTASTRCTTPFCRVIRPTNKT